MISFWQQVCISLATVPTLHAEAFHRADPAQICVIIIDEAIPLISLCNVDEK